MKHWSNYYEEEKGEKTAIKIAIPPENRTDKPAKQEIQKMNKPELNKIPIEDNKSIIEQIKETIEHMDVKGQVTQSKIGFIVSLVNPIETADAIKLIAGLMRINGIKSVNPILVNEKVETFEIKTEE